MRKLFRRLMMVGFLFGWLGATAYAETNKVKRSLNQTSSLQADKLYDECSFFGWQCDYASGHLYYCDYNAHTGYNYVSAWDYCGDDFNERACLGSQCTCGYECQHGVASSLDNCQCLCDRNWGGLRCDTCTRSSSECANGGYVDSASCSCACPQSCNHGSRNDNCACSCNAHWKGSTCDTCAIVQGDCRNGGTLVSSSSECKCSCPTSCKNGGTADAFCNCACASPWDGTYCDRCSLTDAYCKNKGTLDKNTCSCNCNSATACMHGGSPANDGKCGCKCTEMWKGDSCETCDPTTNCHGGMLYNDASKCNCACGNVPCVHGTKTADCQCTCEGGWKGADCSVKSAATSLRAVSALLMGATAFLVTLL